MPAILFICTGNQFRSPIAAGYYLKKTELAGSDLTWVIGSAGTWTSSGLPAHPAAIKAAANYGVDLSTHRSREVDADLVSRFDLVVVMEHNHKEALEIEFPSLRGKVVLLGEIADLLDGEIQDPQKNHFSTPNITTAAICKCIDNGFDKLVELSALQHEKQSI